MQMRAVGFALQSKSESAHIARLKSFNFIQLNLDLKKIEMLQGDVTVDLLAMQRRPWS